MSTPAHKAQEAALLPEHVLCLVDPNGQIMVQPKRLTDTLLENVTVSQAAATQTNSLDTRACETSPSD